MRDTKELSELSENIREQIEEMVKGEIKKRINGLDIYTSKHLNSVQDITIKICDKLGKSEEETIFCSSAAFFHDIGKIFVPSEILQKPTKLTDQEYKIMKLHTIMGFEICNSQEELRKYAKAALYHHENEDGTGYPVGLKGDEIPFEAKAIKVADIYDAIRSKRQYKPEIKRIDALRLVYEQVNTGKVNREIFNALIDVAIDEIKEENGEQEEITELMAMKNCIVLVRSDNSKCGKSEEEKYDRSDIM